MELTAKDKKILNVITQNSKLSLREIAKKTGISVVTVMNHIKALEKEGVISKYSARLNYEKIGYDVEVLIEIKISNGKLFEVEKKIANHPNVFAVYDITGPFDAVVLARFLTRRQMDNFVKTIQTYHFVERTETKLVLNTIKDDCIEII